MVDPIDEAPSIDFQTKSDKIMLKHYLRAKTTEKLAKDEVPPEHNPIVKNDQHIMIK